MQDFLTNPNNIEVIIGAVFALFSLLSAVFQLLGKVSLSKVFGTITPADIGRIIRKLPQIVAFVVQVINLTTKRGGKTVTVLLLIASSTLTSGCAGTLNEASATARLTSIGPVPVTMPATPKRCQSLSDRETWWGAAAIGGAIATGATASTGIASWPVTSHDAKVGIAIGGTALAVGTGIAASVERKTTMTYVKERCGT